MVIPHLTVPIETETAPIVGVVIGKVVTPTTIKVNPYHLRANLFYHNKL
jgi:hypothetical protein